MKTNFTLLTVFLISCVTLFNGNVYAYHDDISCSEDLHEFCQCQGMLGNLTYSNEEFNMLLEPTNHPNFKDMYTFLTERIISCADSKEHVDILTNNECKVAQYTQKFLEFYINNRAKINENIKNERILKMFDAFKQILDEAKEKGI